MHIAADQQSGYRRSARFVIATASPYNFARFELLTGFKNLALSQSD